MQEVLAGAAWTRCSKAIAQTSQVMMVEKRNILTHAYEAGKQASVGKRMNSQIIDQMRNRVGADSLSDLQELPSAIVYIPEQLGGAILPTLPWCAPARPTCPTSTTSDTV